MSDRSQPSRLEAELLARLGLPPHATPQEVAAAHDELVAFLETATGGARAWAERQIRVVDDAYTLLADPTLDQDAAPEEADVDMDELAGIHPATQGAGRANVRRSAQRPASPARRSAATAGRGSGWARAGLAAGGVVAAVAIGIVVFNMNGGTGIPPIDGTPDPEVSAAPSVDPTRVAELMQQITANPRDTAAYLELAGMYWDAGDYATSADFMGKILEYDPDNADALVGRGAARYQQGNTTGAEADWRAAIAIDPNNQEAYFDLGFMYLEQSPPDLDAVTEMWTKVVAIDPTTDMANYAKLHLDSFATPAPSGASQSPEASPASEAPSQSPAESPAASG